MCFPPMLITLKQHAKIGFWEAMNVSAGIDQVHPSTVSTRKKKKIEEKSSHVISVCICRSMILSFHCFPKPKQARGKSPTGSPIS